MDMCHRILDDLGVHYMDAYTEPITHDLKATWEPDKTFLEAIDSV